MITGKSPNTWKLNNTLLNNTWVKENSHLKKLGKEVQDKLKARRRKKIINIKRDMNKIENRKTIEKISERKFNKPPARLTVNKRRH